MKKTKTFNVGDKVFAKVKGYPAWPAKIVAANGRKYEVNFYGTGETGSIKVEDLFYYLKHKEQFCRNLKRKDYIEAVEQIEEEIKVTGTDGNDGNDDNTTAPEETEKVKGRKRKRSEDVRKSITPNDTPQPEENNIPIADTTTEESNDVKPTSQVSRSGRLIKAKRYSSEEPEELEKRPSKRRKSSPEPTADPPKVIEKPMETEDVPETVEKLEESKEDDGPEKKETETKKKLEEEVVSPEKTEDTSKSVKDLKEEKVEVKEEKVEEKEEKVEEDDREQELVDVNVISTEYLNAVIAYAEHVKSNARIYKAKNEEPRDNLPNEVVLARLPTGKTVGIKYGMNHQKTHSEYEKALSDGDEATTILSLKDLVEKGDCKPQDDPNMFVVNLKLPEEESETLRKDARTLERTRTRLNLIKIEASLVDCDAKIKGCLGLDKAEPKKALEYLDIMVSLDVTPLMLKKHPLIVDMVKRLKRYIGNAKEWNLEGEALETFEEDAKKIRARAEEIFIKFKSLFKIPDNKTFWDVFHTAVEFFKDDTKDMKENEVFALYAEPNSRQAFLDSYEEKSEIDLSDDSVLIEKENSPHAVNSNTKLTEEEDEEGDETT